MSCSKHSQRLILCPLQVGVTAEYCYGSLTSTLQKVGIECRVSYLQIKSHTTLLCAIYIARTTKLHIKLGEAEAVCGLTHCLQALASLT